MARFNLRRSMYRGASILGWFNAAARGPAALVKRAVRVEAYKGLGALLRKVLR